MKTQVSEDLCRMYDAVREAARAAVAAGDGPPFDLEQGTPPAFWRSIASSWASFLLVDAVVSGCVVALDELGGMPVNGLMHSPEDPGSAVPTTRTVARAWLVAGLVEPSLEDVEDRVASDLMALGWSHDYDRLCSLAAELVDLARATGSAPSQMPRTNASTDVH